MSFGKYNLSEWYVAEVPNEQVEVFEQARANISANAWWVVDHTAQQVIHVMSAEEIERKIGDPKINWDI